MIALGDVAVNFVISIGWMRGMQAVVDLATETFRFPLYMENKAFPIKFHRPMKYISPLQNTGGKIPKPNLTVFEKDQRLAFVSLPAMDNFVTVIKRFNPNSGWLPVAEDNAARVRSFAAVNVPPNISSPGILRGGGAQRGISNENEKSISFADESGAQGDIAHNYNDSVSSEAAGITGPADPVNAPDGGAGEGAAPGPGAPTRPSVDSDSDNVDLYGSTGSDSS